jgi:hypothetical protein
MTQQQLYLEATLEATEEKTGREWEVTIIGARTPDDLVTVDGRTYIRSKNGRLYSTSAIEESAAQWEGVKVYDNHLTQAEFEAKQGMRSPSKEWLGTIVKPRWDAARNQLRGVFKVVEDSLAKKLKNAHDAGILGAIGLSIDTFPEIGGEIAFEGVRMPTIEGFKKILSVDLVGDPAAGGGFERLIAAATPQDLHNMGANQMDETKLEELFAKLDAKIDGIQANLPVIVRSTIAESLAADVEEEPVQENETEPEADEPVQAEPVNDKAAQDAAAALQEARAARFELLMSRKLAEAKLTEKGRAVVEAAFEGRIVEEKEVQAMIEKVRATEAANDPSGRVTDAGNSRVEVGIGPEDKFALEMQRIIMGNSAFRELEHNSNDLVQERVQENAVYKSWVNHGKPNTGNYGKLSHLLYQYFDGDPLLNNRAYEAATTSSLATVVKNTVNIMVAADYSARERWYEPLVKTEEVDTIDDTTLARVYGVSTLSTVNEGAAYTELPMADEEETASFVKRGNYIGITMETLMRDKINFVRRIPTVLSNTWFNTLSSLVSGVFTVNSAAGPVLSDTGALFNATAVGTAGGHANLLTTALSYAAFDAARTAMRKQTDMTLGAGRKLLLEPKYLLVPVDLEATAYQIRNSELVPEANGAGTTGNQSINRYRGQFEVITVPDWTDTNNWALMADPMQAPSIYLIFPRGQRTPQLFTADQETNGAMFTNDELRFKIRQLTYRFSSTYDCAPVADFRGLHKSNV